MSINCVEPDILSPEEVARLYDQLDDIRAWVNAVEAEALRLAREDRLPRHKVVAGRSLRKWKDEDEAEQAFTAAGFTDEDMYTKKFMSVAQAEKLLGKALFRKLAPGLVFRTEGKPIVVLDTDPRPAVSAAAEFSKVKRET